MDDNSELIYLIDSSAIFDLYKEVGHYSKDVHASLWDTIEEYIQKGRIKSSVEVYEEVKKDTQKEFTDWVKSNKDMFIEVDECQIKNLKKILAKYPMLAEGFTGKADTTLVSLCMCNSWILLTSENFSTTASPYTPKIPNLCNEFEVKCMNINQFCRNEGLKI